jgi:hypothetical protein
MSLKLKHRCFAEVILTNRLDVLVSGDGVLPKKTRLTHLKAGEAGDQKPKKTLNNQATSLYGIG